MPFHTHDTKVLKLGPQILNVNFNGSQINQYLISRRQVNKRTKWV